MSITARLQTTLEDLPVPALLFRRDNMVVEFANSMVLSELQAGANLETCRLIGVDWTDAPCRRLVEEDENPSILQYDSTQFFITSSTPDDAPLCLFTHHVASSKAAALKAHAYCASTTYDAIVEELDKDEWKTQMIDLSDELEEASLLLRAIVAQRGHEPNSDKKQQHLQRILRFSQILWNDYAPGSLREIDMWLNAQERGDRGHFLCLQTGHQEGDYYMRPEAVFNPERAITQACRENMGLTRRRMRTRRPV